MPDGAFTITPTSGNFTTPFYSKENNIKEKEGQFCEIFAEYYATSSTGANGTNNILTIYNILGLGSSCDESVLDMMFKLPFIQNA